MSTVCLQLQSSAASCNLYLKMCYRTSICASAIVESRNHIHNYSQNKAVFMHFGYVIVCYTRKQHWTFDSILSGFTVAWLHVSPQDVCFFCFVFYHYNLVSVCLSPPVFSAWDAHLSVENSTQYIKAVMMNDEKLFRKAEWWAGCQQLHPCIRHQYRIPTSGFILWTTEWINAQKQPKPEFIEECVHD